MLNWIRVWRVGWVVGGVGFVVCKKLLHYIRGMEPRIVLLEYRIAKWVIDLLQDRKKVLVKHPPVDVRGDGFCGSGTRWREAGKEVVV